MGGIHVLRLHLYMFSQMKVTANSERTSRHMHCNSSERLVGICLEYGFAVLLMSDVLSFKSRLIGGVESLFSS